MTFDQMAIRLEKHRAMPNLAVKAPDPEAKEADDGNAAEELLINELMISDVKLKGRHGPSTMAIIVSFAAIGNRLT